MLVIRLSRTGRRNTATFRVVLQEKARSPKSSVLEILGSLTPQLKERKDQVQLKEDRIKYWLSQGAQPSNTVHNMLVEFGIIDAPKKRSVQPKLKPQEEGAEAPAAVAPAAEGEKPADAPAEKPAEEKKEEVKAE